MCKLKLIVSNFDLMVGDLNQVSGTGVSVRLGYPHRLETGWSCEILLHSIRKSSSTYLESRHQPKLHLLALDHFHFGAIPSNS